MPSLTPTATPSREPSNMPSSNPSHLPTSECSQELRGRTIFSKINAMGQKVCIKIELFPGGVLAIDSSNLDCIAANESTSLQILSSFQDSTDKILFNQGNLGPTAFIGHFNVLEDPTVTEIETNLLSLINQSFVAELKLPTCIAPSSTPSSIHSIIPSHAPSTDCSQQLMGSTIFSKIGTSLNPNSNKVCLKIELNPGGSLTLDSSNSDCIAANESPSQQSISSFQSITDKVSFVNVGRQIWSGHFYISEDPSISDIETNLIGVTVNDNNYIFEAELRLPTCIAPSSAPSSIPSILSCKVKNPSWIGDGFCDDNVPGYYTKGCDWDGGDCDTLKKKYPSCPGPLAFLNDCECDENLNIEECGYDDGDCLKRTPGLCDIIRKRVR